MKEKYLKYWEECLEKARAYAASAKDAAVSEFHLKQMKWWEDNAAMWKEKADNAKS